MMAKIYRNLIKKKLLVIEDVPERYQEATLEELALIGLDGHGDALA